MKKWPNKKVLLRERKRHTTHHVAIASPCYSGGAFPILQMWAVIMATCAIYRKVETTIKLNAVIVIYFNLKLIILYNY